MQSRTVTVATAADEKTFTRLDDVKTALGAFAADAVITSMIDEVSGEIADALDFPQVAGDDNPLAETGYVETIWANNCMLTQRLSRMHLIEAPTVTIDGASVDAACIEVNTRLGEVTYYSGNRQIPWPAGKIVFTYTAGFVMPPVDVDPTAPSRRLPKQLERAAIDLIRYRRIQAGDESMCPPVKAESFPGIGQFTYDLAAPSVVGGMPEHVSRTLDRYRFPLMGWN